jgi:hypothetical protein
MRRIAALFLVLAACGSDAKSPQTPNAASSLADRLMNEEMAILPEVGRYSGLHQYDGLIGDYSAAGIAHRISVLQERKRILTSTKPQNDNEALDFDLLNWDADEALFWLVERKSQEADPSFYENLFSLNGYIDREYAPFERRFEKLVEHEEKALAQVPNIRANLRPPLAKPLVEVGVGIYKGYAEYLRADVVRFAAQSKDAALNARFQKANTSLASEADKLGDWLKTLPTDNQGHVLGAERFNHLVDVYAGRHISLAEFESIGEANLARDKDEYDKLKPKVHEPLPKPTAANLISTAAQITEDARKFIVDHHVVTLASDEKAKVIETPPYKRFNAAWLDTGGAYDPPLGAFFYVTPPDASWPADQQLAYIPTNAELRATATHEVYPGHFVQYGWIRRAPTMTQKILGSATFIEGWAHYGEQMMAEEGFSADPESHFGQITEAMLRDCRFIVALGVHTKGMTMEQAQKRFIEECHQTEPVAREQSTRAAFHPWYFAYTLGKLQILALRDECKTALGSGFSLQRFHDSLLSHGQGPVGLIRPRVLRDLGIAPSPKPQ